MGTQVVMIDASRGNHRQKDVNEPLERVDAEVTGMRFEVPGECGSLLGSSPLLISHSQDTAISRPHQA